MSFLVNKSMYLGSAHISSLGRFHKPILLVGWVFIELTSTATQMVVPVPQTLPGIMHLRATDSAALLSIPSLASSPSVPVTVVPAARDFRLRCAPGHPLWWNSRRVLSFIARLWYPSI